MDDILIACGDIDLLRRIVSDLPDEVSNPLATKKGAGMVERVNERDVDVALVHEQLRDDGSRELCEGLAALEDGPPLLLLTASSPPDEGPFDRAMRYPVPGPVLRNALESMRPDDADDEELERWKQFYREVKVRLKRLPEQNYFEMLGVETGAPHHEIVDAFDRLTTRYHPDRYQKYRDRKWGRALHERVVALYTTLTEAYQVLSDRKLRSKYENLLQRGELRMPEDALSHPDEGPESLTDLSDHPKVERFLEMAQRELAKDNPEDALQHLEFATTIEPNNDALAERIESIRARSDDA
jgi:hypothetical protein